jgi:hypothetical protein
MLPVVVTTEEQRITLAHLHALSLAALRGADAPGAREHLETLALLAPDPPGESLDPRDDARLLEGLLAEPGPARRLAAQVRGVLVGAGAHADTVLREVVALVRALDGASAWTERQWTPRIELALARTREDLTRDVVFVRPVPSPSSAEETAVLRRWGGLRALELNAFVAALTRDGTHAAAVAATSRGPDAVALRFALAVANAALSLALSVEPSAPSVRALREDARRVEEALAPLMANVVRAGR